MLAYIKDFSTFKTTYMDTPQDWDVPIASSTMEEGTVTLPSRGRKDFSHDWIYLDEHIFLIDNSEPNGGVVNLTVSDPANMFSRQLFYPDEPAATYGEFIEQAIRENFILCEDPVYAVPYLDVKATDRTPFEEPKQDDSGLYSLIDVINAAREKGIAVDFKMAVNRLSVEIYTINSQPHNVVFYDGHAKLEQESYSRATVAKITTVQATATEGEFVIEDWYLDSDGVICDTVPAKRMEGDWKYITVGKDEDPLEKASEEFKNNLGSHKIEFYSDRDYHLWDTVKFQIDGEIFESRIVAKFLSSKNSRWLYTCGDLATTLTEKVQKLS